MTFNEAAGKLYNTSLGGYFNREKFTPERLKEQLKAQMRNPENNLLPNACIMEIALPDGWWTFTFDYIPSCDCYDFTIPETREQEAALKDRIKAATREARRKARRETCFG